MNMIETVSAGGIVINEKNEVALVMNGTGGPWWGFPKGHVDAGEEILTAAKREIQEETGLTEIQYVKPLGEYKRYRGKPGGGYDVSEMKHIHMFLFKAANGPLQPTDPQNPEARWFSKEQVLQLITLPEDRGFFERVLQEIGI